MNQMLVVSAAAVADSVTTLDRARTDGGLGVVYDGTRYLCRDVRSDPAYAEYHALLADAQINLACSPAQGRLALLAAGLLDTVEEWIATQPRAVQIEYASRTEWRRDWPLITTAASAMNLTDEQIDALFQSAQAL